MAYPYIASSFLYHLPPCCPKMMLMMMYVCMYACGCTYYCTMMMMLLLYCMSIFLYPCGRWCMTSMYNVTTRVRSVNYVSFNVKLFKKIWILINYEKTKTGLPLLGVQPVYFGLVTIFQLVCIHLSKHCFFCIVFLFFLLLLGLIIYFLCELYIHKIQDSMLKYK